MEDGENKESTSLHFCRCLHCRARRERKRMTTRPPPPLPPLPPYPSVAAPPTAPFLPCDLSESTYCFFCKTWNLYMAERKQKQQQMQLKRLDLGVESAESSDDMEGALYRVRCSPKEFDLPCKIAAQGVAVDAEDQQTCCPAPVPAPSISCLIEEKAGEQEEQERLTKQPLEKENDYSRMHNNMELNSTNTLHKVWCHPEAYTLTSFSFTERARLLLKYTPIDSLYTGYFGAPILDKNDHRTTIEYEADFCREFDELSKTDRTQSIALRFEQLRLFQHQCNCQYYQELDSNEQLEKRSLDMITNKVQRRFQCPMGHPECPLLLNKTLLAHFLEVHLSVAGMTLSEVYEREQIIIELQPRTFQRAENICLSTIVYDESKSKVIKLPNYNSELPIDYIKYIGHMPFFVMACRTRLRPSECRNIHFQQHDKPQSTNSLPNDLAKSSSEATCETASASASAYTSEKATENVLILWMVGMELPQSMHVHMTVFNSRLDISRTSIMQVRALKKSHNTQQFLAWSKNYMRLTGQDLRLLTNNYSDPIYLELSIRQFKSHMN